MKSSRIAISRLALTILVVAGTLLVAAPNAFAIVRVPGGDVPFYARLGRGDLYHDDEWAAVVFYRPPSCVRPDFNLLDFFDIPAAFDCTPLTTEGFENWANGPEIDAAPELTKLQGLGAVPVWFVPWPALQAAIADDMLTIGELESLPHLVGAASAYHETLRPLGVVKIATTEFDARGALEDGRSFQVHAQAVDFSATPPEVNWCDVHCLTRIAFK
jgi:hypothetical protein